MRKYQRPLDDCSIASVDAADGAGAEPELLGRALEALRVLALPEAQDRGNYEAQRNEPEEEPVRQASGQERAAGDALPVERVEGVRDAGHSLLRPGESAFVSAADARQQPHVHTRALARGRLALDRLELLLIDRAIVEQLLRGSDLGRRTAQRGGRLN